MANKRFWLGMLVMALVFGMTVVGCSDGSTDGDSGNGGGSTSGSGGVDSALNGTWIANEANGVDASEIILAVKFNNGNWEESIDGIPMVKGNYTTNSGTITIKITHVHSKFFLDELDLESKWYSLNEVKTKYPDADFTFVYETTTYSVTGNTLTIGEGDHKEVYTRK